MLKNKIKEMKFFKPPFTTDHIEEQYKRLCKKLHPDKGGSKEDFSKMIDEKILILEVVRQTLNQYPKPKIKMRRQPKVILRPGYRIDVTEKDVDNAIKSLGELILYAKELKKIFK